MSLTGHIIEWSRERGFGFLECEGRRIFLHRRDFAEQHKAPEVGDQIDFELGVDRLGRPCAQQAVHRHDGGRLRPAHFLILTGLILPGFAVYRGLGPPAVGYAGGWVLLISALTFGYYEWDKGQAKLKQWRESERMLHLLELLGGWPGAFIAQRYLRHKSSKGFYQFVFVLIIGLHQFLAIDALNGWPFCNLLLRSMQNS